MLLVIRGVPIDNETSMVTSSNIKNLPSQSSKTLIGVGRVCVRAFIGVRVWWDVPCNRKKNLWMPDLISAFKVSVVFSEDMETQDPRQNFLLSYCCDWTCRPGHLGVGTQIQCYRLPCWGWQGSLSRGRCVVENSGVSNAKWRLVTVTDCRRMGASQHVASNSDMQRQ